MTWPDNLSDQRLVFSDWDISIMDISHQVPTNRKQRRRCAAHSRAVTKNKRILSPDFVISPPRHLSFEATAETTRVFFKELRDLIDRKTRAERVLVDLSSLEKIDLGSALVLVAEFDRWQRLYGIILTPSTINNWNKNVVSKLKSLGFFDLLKTSLNGFHISSKKAHWIPFMSGTLTIGKAAKKLKNKLTTVLGRGNKGHFLPIYEPLIESMKNAIQHAYPEENGEHSVKHYYGKRWWMAAEYNSENNFIQVAFLDLGITIPVSLPSSWLWKDIKPKETDFADVTVIAEALKYGQSRLGQKHRGKGFGNIMAPAFLDSNNVVTIVSRKGQCLVTPLVPVIGIEADTPFAGTLIRWYIKLPQPGEQ